MTITPEVKSEVLLTCETQVQSKLEKIKHSISDIVESLESETKSTAGDKHQTDRAMMDIEREQLGQRLALVEHQQSILKAIRQRNNKPSKIIHVGSLVATSKGVYYIAVSLGTILIKSQKIYVISKESPIGLLLMNKTEKDQISFNGETFNIKKVL